MEGPKAHAQETEGDGGMKIKMCQVCGKREAVKSLDAAYHGVQGVIVRTCCKCSHHYLEVCKAAARLQMQGVLAAPGRL
jgi:hypothetical protein